MKAAHAFAKTRQKFSSEIPKYQNQSRTSLWEMTFDSLGEPGIESCFLKKVFRICFEKCFFIIYEFKMFLVFIQATVAVAP